MKAYIFPGQGSQKSGDFFQAHGFKHIQIANLNTPSQIVISGDLSEIQAAKPKFEADGTTRYMMLNVSGAKKLLDETADLLMERFDRLIHQKP